MDSGGGGDGAEPGGGGAAGSGGGGAGGGGGGWDADGDGGGFCGSSNPSVTVLSPAKNAAAAVAKVSRMNPSSSSLALLDSTVQEPVPILVTEPPVIYCVDEAGVLFESQQSAVDSEYLYRCTQPSLNNNIHSDEVEVEDYLVTQQSKNLRKDKHVSVVENLSDTEDFLDDYSEEDGADGDSESDVGFDYDMGEYRAGDVEARMQEETELKLNSLKRKRADEQGHYEGESEVEELFPIPDSEDSDAFVPIATYKKKTVRKGPTSRSHGSVECTSNPDYFPSDDHYYVEISEDDSDDTPVLLPSGRKSRAKKMKPRMWYDERWLLPEQQFCLKLCFVDVYQFRIALQKLHISQLRGFMYHRNTPASVIAMCTDEECPFYMTATKIAGEKTFCIRKMHLDHTCAPEGESCKVTAKWLSKTAEQAFRADPRTRVETVMDNAKQTHGVVVGKVMAYRARRKALKVVIGDDLKQYRRIRDYLQTVIDTNPGSRCIVTTKMVLEVPNSNPMFHGLFMALGASITGFTKGCRPFIGKFLSAFLCCKLLYHVQQLQISWPSIHYLLCSTQTITSDEKKINTRKIGGQVKTASSNRHPRHLQQHSNIQQQLHQAAGHRSKPAQQQQQKMQGSNSSKKQEQQAMHRNNKSKKLLKQGNKQQKQAMQEANSQEQAMQEPIAQQEGSRQEHPHQPKQCHHQLEDLLLEHSQHQDLTRLM